MDPEALKFDTPQELIEFLRRADYAYFHSDAPLVDDKTYEILRAHAKSKLPNDPYFKEIDADLPKQVKKLDYPMFSLDKIKYTEPEALGKWLAKSGNNYVITPKYDGKAGQLVYGRNGRMKLYSRRRGGFNGTDISQFIPYLNIPRWSQELVGLTVRGELIIPLIKFDPKLGKNPRAVVNGIFNRDDRPESAGIADFIAYDILSERTAPSRTLRKLAKLGFKVPPFYQLERDEITVDYLRQILFCEKEENDYEFDGLVIDSDEAHELSIDGNPDYAIAFKEETPNFEAIVDHVEWKVHATGSIAPVIILKHSVDIGGTTNRKMTIHNAKFVVEGGIGPGAVILMTRSNDVIPRYVATIVPVEPQLPDLPFTWNENHTKIYLENREDDESFQISQINKFVSKLGLKQIGSKTIETLYEYGVISNVVDFINLTREDLNQDISGFGDIKKRNILKQVEEIRNRTFLEFMVASNMFGERFGERMLKPVLEQFPEIQDGDIPDISDIIKIKGYERKTATALLDGLYKFNRWIEDNNLEWIRELDSFEDTQREITSNKLQGEVIVFTGFRDASLKESILSRGGEYKDSYSKKITIVVKSDKSTTSNTIEKAIKDGKKIYTKTEFEKFIM